MSEILRRVQALVLAGDYEVSHHGFRELAADDIVLADVVAGIGTAILVENYPESRKEPSVLILQHERTGQQIHVMWGVPKTAGRPAILVTAYRPAPERWSLTMSADDARKLDTVRLALKRGDIAEAAKYGRVFELKPVAAE